MSRTSTNGAEVFVGSNEVANVVDITFTVPERTEIASGALNEDVPEVVGIGSKGSYTLDVEVEIDDADTNGQGALDAAYEAKSSITAGYYPEGKTAGNVEYTGTAYVTKIPNRGGQGKNAVKTGSYRIVYSGSVTKGTVSA